MFRKAERKKAKLRLGITGPAGSGKTYSALLIAFGLGGRVAVIDTESGSADLYSHLGDYDVCPIEAPFTVKKYLDAMAEAERAGYDVLVVDSLSHAWAGEGGLLDKQGKIADASRSGNSYAAWRQVTPEHNKLVEAILTSKCHVIATMRSKVEYAQDKDSGGKTVVRKVGLAPVQRDGMEYEFGVVLDIDSNHNATVSKDRTSLFDGQIFTPSQKTGEVLKAWLESGVDVPPQEAAPKPTGASGGAAKRKQALWHEFLEICDGQEQHAKNAMKKVVGDLPSKDWTPEDLEQLEAELRRRQSAKEFPAVELTSEDEAMLSEKGLK